MDKFSLLSINSQTNCTGPIETFYSNNGTIKTTVDHIFISEDHINLVQSCHIGDDDSGNLSIHRPIFCVLNVCAGNITGENKPKTVIAWKKMSVPAIRENYQRTISAAFEQLNADESLLTDITSIEKRLTDVTNLLQTCAERSIPKVKFKKYLKPYWKQGLKPMHDRCRYYRKIWIFIYLL